MHPSLDDALRHEMADRLRGIVDAAAELGNGEVLCRNIFRCITNHDNLLSIPLNDLHWLRKITAV